jgi:hypothetical protein
MIKLKFLSSDVVKMCEHFAENCYKTNADEYQRRNQKNLNKIKKDIALGKMAEFAVYFIFLEKGISDISIPDLNIYGYKNKSFERDLKCKNYNFHIKTQSLESALKFGESWMFQKKDPVIENPQKNDYFIGTQINEDTFETKILLSKPILELKFGEPKLQKLISKTCIYLKDNL